MQFAVLSGIFGSSSRQSRVSGRGFWTGRKVGAGDRCSREHWLSLQSARHPARRPPAASRSSGLRSPSHQGESGNFERNRWLNQISWCHRVLGDLDADAGQHDSAREHYDTALKIARSISFRPVLIEALFARRSWAAKYMKDATSAFNDLNEALGYTVEGGYRRYEADIRVALAWANVTPIPSPSPVGTADGGRSKRVWRRSARCR